MYNVNCKELKRMETTLFKYGLCGGGSVLPVSLEDGTQVKKDFHYLYDNHNICVRFYYSRLDSGMWYNLKRIQFENFKTGKIITFNAID